MQDKIIISRLMVYCNHGVYEEEKINGQNFYVSAEIILDTEKPGHSDDITDAVNYAEICVIITEFMQHNNFNLIEAVAENLAEFILEYSPLIKGVNLRIDKPEAPVLLPFDTIAVSISRSWHKAYLGIGSNMGDSRAIIEDAFDKLREYPGIRVNKISTLITTKPYGNVEQNDFLNGVISIETRLNPYELLDVANKLETEANRVRDVHWGPRTLDVDILLYDEEIIHNEKLIVPHIDMHNRKFVLEPMCEIAPYVYHPVLHKTMGQLLEELNQNNN